METPLAKINLANISHNIAQIKKVADKSKVLAVIKANAYGHGALRVAKFLEQDSNVSAFGVARLDEAQELIRNTATTKPILVMEGVLDVKQLSLCSELGLWVVMHDFTQLYSLNNANISKPIKIWLKFDTGMHRLGFLVEECQKVFENIDSLIQQNKIDHDYVIMTHFSSADIQDSKVTSKQLELFDSIKQLHQVYFNKNQNNTSNSGRKIEYSLANSAGIFAFPESHGDWVRPGISMYGSSPFDYIDREALNLKSTMDLTCKVITTKIVKKGEAVGYKGMWRAGKDTLIAVVACGYADCYPRVLTKPSYVFLHNRLCRIIGLISMDMLAIDCSELPDTETVQIGDEVELWGSSLSIDMVAESCATISNELYCRTTSRVKRIYD